MMTALSLEGATEIIVLKATVGTYLLPVAVVPNLITVPT